MTRLSNDNTPTDWLLLLFKLLPTRLVSKTSSTVFWEFRPGSVLDLPIGRIGRGLGAADFWGRQISEGAKEYNITNKTCARHQGRERPMSVRCP
jgi:hypothetical protein